MGLVIYTERISRHLGIKHYKEFGEWESGIYYSRKISYRFEVRV